jgi:hypothetical protein
MPLIDLLILIGWSSLFIGAVQKAIWITTSLRPSILTLGPVHFFWVATICLFAALSLALRRWLKRGEGKSLSWARARRALSPRD